MTEQKTHWRKIIESDYLAGADLDDGHGNHPPITVTIREVKQEMVMDPGTKKNESCLILKFAETKWKPMICNATNAKAISKATGSDYIQDWPGKQIQIGTERVKAFGELWDALRVKPFAPKQSAAVTAPAPVCADCQQIISDYEGVSGTRIAAATSQKYGRPLCVSCADKLKKKDGEPVATE